MLIADRITVSAAEMATDVNLLTQAIKNAGLEIDPEALVPTMIVRQMPSSRRVAITVSNENAKDAKRLAVAIGNEVVAQVRRSEKTAKGRVNLAADLSVMDVLSGKPTKSSRLMMVLIGLVAGLVSGVTLAFVFERLNKTFRDSEDFEQFAAGVSVLAEIPQTRTSAASGLVVDSQQDPAITEAFSMLNARISAAGPQSKTILITSPGSGEKRTLVIANIAAALATSGKRVLLIDSSEEPALPKLLNIESPAEMKLSKVSNAQSGLGSTCEINGGIDPEKAIIDTDIENLFVVSAAAQSLSLVQQLSAGRKIDEIISEVKQQFDLIIMNVGGRIHAINAATAADEIILVIEANSTRRQDTDKFLKAIRQLSNSNIGAVITGV